MKPIRAKLNTSIPGPGFVIRNGYHVGELDEYGVIWLMVSPTNRIPGERQREARIGIHAAKFAWMEEPAEPGAERGVNKRAEINAKIKAAEETAKAAASKARA